MKTKNKATFRKRSSIKKIFTRMKDKGRKNIQQKKRNVKHRSLLNKQKLEMSLTLSKITLKKRAESLNFTISVMDEETSLNEKNESNSLSEEVQGSSNQVKPNLNEIGVCETNFSLSQSNDLFCKNIEVDLIATKNNEENGCVEEIGYCTMNKDSKWIALDQSDDEIFAGPFNKKKEWSISRRRTLIKSDDKETIEVEKNKPLSNCRKNLEFGQMNEFGNSGEEEFSFSNDCLEMEEKEKINDIGIIEQFEKRETTFNVLGESYELEKGDYYTRTIMPEFQQDCVLVDNDMKDNERGDAISYDIQSNIIRAEEQNKFAQLVNQKTFCNDNNQNIMAVEKLSQNEMKPQKPPQESKQTSDHIEDPNDSLHRMMIVDPDKFKRQIRKTQNRKNVLKQYNIYLENKISELKNNFASVSEEKDTLLEFKKSTLKVEDLKDKILKLRWRNITKIRHIKKLSLNLHTSKTKQKILIRKKKHLHVLNKYLLYHEKQLTKSQKSLIDERIRIGQEIKKHQTVFQRLEYLCSELVDEKKALTQKYDSLLETNAEFKYELQKSKDLNTQLENKYKQLSLEKNKQQENIAVFRTNYPENNHKNTSAKICKKATANIFDEFCEFDSFLPARTYYPNIPQEMCDVIEVKEIPRQSQHSVVNKTTGAENNVEILASEIIAQTGKPFNASVQNCGVSFKNYENGAKDLQSVDNSNKTQITIIENIENHPNNDYSSHISKIRKEKSIFKKHSKKKYCSKDETLDNTIYHNDNDRQVDLEDTSRKDSNLENYIATNQDNSNKQPLECIYKGKIKKMKLKNMNIDKDKYDSKIVVDAKEANGNPHKKFKPENTNTENISSDLKLDTKTVENNQYRAQLDNSPGVELYVDVLASSEKKEQEICFYTGSIQKSGVSTSRNKNGAEKMQNEINSKTYEKEEKYSNYVPSTQKSKIKKEKENKIVFKEQIQRTFCSSDALLEGKNYQIDDYNQVDLEKNTEKEQNTSKQKDSYEQTLENYSKCKLNKNKNLNANYVQTPVNAKEVNRRQLDDLKIVNTEIAGENTDDLKVNIKKVKNAECRAQLMKTTGVELYVKSLTSSENIEHKFKTSNGSIQSYGVSFTKDKDDGDEMQNEKKSKNNERINKENEDKDTKTENDSHRSKKKKEKRSKIDFKEQLKKGYINKDILLAGKIYKNDDSNQVDLQDTTATEVNILQNINTEEKNSNERNSKIQYTEIADKNKDILKDNIKRIKRTKNKDCTALLVKTTGVQLDVEILASSENIEHEVKSSHGPLQSCRVSFTTDENGVDAMLNEKMSKNSVRITKEKEEEKTKKQNYSHKSKKKKERSQSTLKIKLKKDYNKYTLLDGKNGQNDESNQVNLQDTTANEQNILQNINKNQLDSYEKPLEYISKSKLKENKKKNLYSYDSRTPVNAKEANGSQLEYEIENTDIEEKNSDGLKVIKRDEKFIKKDENTKCSAQLVKTMRVELDINSIDEMQNGKNYKNNERINKEVEDKNINYHSNTNKSKKKKDKRNKSTFKEELKKMYCNKDTPLEEPIDYADNGKKADIQDKTKKKPNTIQGITKDQEYGCKLQLENISKCRLKKKKKEKKILNKYDFPSAANDEVESVCQSKKIRVEKNYIIEKNKENLKLNTKTMENNKCRNQLSKGVEESDFITSVNRENNNKKIGKDKYSKEKSSALTSFIRLDYQELEIGEKNDDQEMEITVENISKSKRKKKKIIHISSKSNKRLNETMVNHEETK